MTKHAMTKETRMPNDESGRRYSIWRSVFVIH